jgi:hypothetical protein
MTSDPTKRSLKYLRFSQAESFFVVCNKVIMINKRSGSPLLKLAVNTSIYLLPTSEPFVRDIFQLAEIKVSK